MSAALRLAASGRRLAIAEKGWWAAHRWWLLRRTTQAAVLLLFLLGPWVGIWLARGNFASSEILGALPLSDPYVALQSIAAGHWPQLTVLAGAAFVLAFYLVVGGRAYCAWVCPVNVVTDAAFWCREQLGITRDRKLDPRTRRWLLAATLAVSALTGTIAWEFVNPVSTLQRGLIFGMGAGWLIVLAVFLLDLFVTRRGWCSHLCPVGAFYGLVGRTSLVRVGAVARERCTDCGACFKVCTEPHVITPALKGTGGRLILSGDCTNCASCIDACPVDVFALTTRLAADPAARIPARAYGRP